MPPNAPVTPQRKKKNDDFLTSPPGHLLSTSQTRPESGGTPRRSGKVDYSPRMITEIRDDIGTANNEDILKCLDVWKFIEYYCPTNALSVERLREQGKTLAKQLKLEHIDKDPPEDTTDGRTQECTHRQKQGANGTQPKGTTATSQVQKSYDWFDNEKPPRDSARNETEYFNEYVNICNAIKTHSNLQFNNILRTLANDTLDSQTYGSDFKIDACFLKGTSVVQNAISIKDIATTDVLVTLEYKNDNNLDDVLDNRRKVVSAVFHIMHDDIRRKFMYAISVENRRMTVWYFARDHCVRTTFNWWQYKATMISIFLSFMCATEEELGFDPRIHLLPPSRTRTDMAKRYVYELEDDTQTKHYYRTEKPILELRGTRITGRKTRVFEVVKVKSNIDNADHKDQQRLVLKDAWMDDQSENESKIQEELFAAIQKFVDLPIERQSERLKGWTDDGALPSTIGDYLGQSAKKDFRDLFVRIELESTGPPLRKIHSQHLRIPARPTFYPKSAEAPNGAHKSSTRCPSDATPLKQRNLRATSETIGTLKKSDLVFLRTFPTKKRTFIIFKEFCQTINDLSTVGEALEVLQRTVVALLLMYCANWVHRDISVGNVMACKNPTTGKWESKLGDLEYARLFGAQGESNDPKTGTAYFMAAEVLRTTYFPAKSPRDLDSRVKQLNEDLKQGFPPKATGSTKVPVKVVYNFYHDVEAIFWILYWIVTCCVDCQDSRDHVSKIFSLEVAPNDDKNQALAEEISPTFTQNLLPDLQPLSPYLERLRSELWEDTCLRNKNQSFDTYQYSSIHYSVFQLLGPLCDPRQSWYNVQLEKFEFPHFVIKETRDKAPKRDREQDSGDDGEPAKRSRDVGTLESEDDKFSGFPPDQPVAGPSRLREL